MDQFFTNDERDVYLLDEIVDAVRDGLHSNAIDRILGPTVRRMVMSQSYILLDKQLDIPVRRIVPKPLAYDAPTAEGLVKEFDTVIGHVQSVMANAIRTRLLEVVRRHVHEVYEEALGNTPEIPTNPPRGGGGGVRVSSSNGHAHEPVTAGAAHAVDSHVPTRGPVDSVTAPTPAQTPESVAASVLTAAPAQTPVQAVQKAALDPVEEEPVEQTLLRLVETLDEAPVEPAFAEEEESSPLQQAPAARLDGVADDEVYEGTVRLTVEPSGGMKQVLQFVDELRRKPELRLLQLVGTRKDGVDIWLGLREPLHLKRTLSQIDGVSRVSAVPDPDGAASEERVLTVELLQKSA
jgi:hypothetical protein